MSSSSQERRSPTSSSSNNNTPLRASQAQDGYNPHRYSSPVSSNSYNYSSSSTRRYATPEESDAVLPTFTTPTYMYIKQELNQRHAIPSPKQQYASPSASSPAQQQQGYTTQQQQKNYNTTPTTNGYTDTKLPGSPLAQPASSNQYSRTRGESNPTRPSVDHFGMKSMESEVNNLKDNHQNMPNGGASTPTLTPQQDLLLAQLVDMGFTLEASRVAMIASGGTNLQEILDILVTDTKLEKQTAGTNYRHSQPPPLPRHGSNPSTTSGYNQSPPSSSNYQQQQPAPPPRTNLNHQQAPSSTNYRPSPAATSDYNPTSNTHYNQQTPQTPQTPQTSSKSDDDEDEDPRLEREREEAFKRQQEERRKEYLDQLKREKPTPPKPSPRPPPKSPSPPIFTDPATLLYAEKERKQGNYLFNKNQFVEAESAYTLAINALPPGSTELVLLCNNRAAARLKQSKYQGCLTDCAMAIDVARKQMMSGSQDPALKQQMIKALHRKASALEGLCLFEAAIQVYEEYVRLDGSRSAQVTQGIMRCQQAILDIKKGQQKRPPQQPPRPTSSGTFKPATNNEYTAFPDIDFNMFIPQQQNKANLEEINNSKAVQEMRDREKKREAEETERLLKEDQVNAHISVWKTGKDKNLRALLGSLELILWPGVQWKGVQMSELLEPRKCKVTYMKAIAKVHPDKLPANATVEQKMLASGIFTTLNQAWDVFKAQNNL